MDIEQSLYYYTIYPKYIEKTCMKLSKRKFGKTIERFQNKEDFSNYRIESLTTPK